ncbi:glycosyltransferase [Vibrio tritonius]|uniref:Glycosyltransferase n=1 Tax=Vibrio tritonius TaxID=1435069 RepID=A0ABS7YJ63_9VIBR|nr:glycosyltransferase [Vibrio tritonius]MCA2015713.1 glycosyltransferase [Vibrio tritonius]
MKVVYLTTVDLDDGSAQAQQIKSMSISFDRILSDDFFVFSYSNCDQKLPVKNHISYKTSNSKLLRSINLIFRSMLLVRGKKCYFTRDMYIALLLCIFGYKAVWEIHQAPSKFASFFLRILSLFDNFKLLSISKNLGEIDTIKVKEKNKFFYHDGVDVSLYESIQETTSDLEKIALYTGSLHKGDDVDSLSSLFKKFPDWSFVIIGGKPFEVQNFKKKYQNLDNVKFLGRLSHSDVIKYQKSADVLLYPLTKSNHLWKYTSPLKLFEYMAAKKSIIASCIGSVKEVISSDSAYIYDDVKSIDDAFYEFINSPLDEREKKIRTSYEMIEKTYNWDARCKYILNEILL